MVTALHKLRPGYVFKTHATPRHPEKFAFRSFVWGKQENSWGSHWAWRRQSAGSIGVRTRIVSSSNKDLVYYCAMAYDTGSCCSQCIRGLGEERARIKRKILPLIFLPCEQVENKLQTSSQEWYLSLFFNHIVTTLSGLHHPDPACPLLGIYIHVRCKRTRSIRKDVEVNRDFLGVTHTIVVHVVKTPLIMEIG